MLEGLRKQIKYSLKVLALDTLLPNQREFEQARGELHQEVFGRPYGSALKRVRSTKEIQIMRSRYPTGC